MVKRRYAPEGSTASNYARTLAAQAEHHSSILHRERALRHTHQGEVTVHNNDTQFPDVRKERPYRSYSGEKRVEDAHQQHNSTGDHLTGFLPKIVQDSSDPPPPEISRPDYSLHRPTTAEPDPNPPDSKKREIYMGSSAVQSAIEGGRPGSTGDGGSSMKGKTTFMSTMADLRPGLSDDQRRRAKEQKETLRNQLEQQVIERKQREAREKAERQAREEQEDAEIRAYHQKLKEREEQERLRRLEATKVNEVNPGGVSLRGPSMGRDPPAVVRHHQMTAAQDRDERVLGVAGSLPVKQPRHEAVSTYRTPEPMPDMLGRTTVENRRISPSSSVASSFRSMERDPVSGKPIARLSGGYTFEELHAQHQKLDLLKREQIQMREEVARLTTQMKEAAHPPPRMPSDRTENARRAIRDTEAFLNSCGSHNDDEDYFVATTHLLPKNVAQIPSALPAAFDTEVCRLGERFVENEFPNGQNENEANVGQPAARVGLGNYSGRGMQAKGRNDGHSRQMGGLLDGQGDEASKLDGVQKRGLGAIRQQHRGNAHPIRKLEDENHSGDKGQLKKIWRW
ncbi:hypothetical protein BSKO_13011 [Bryopsis sp. KO-2023]|nr:hypothetical protein BSKO_13011 [Bryopsis sp. KO-2023]